MRRPIRRALLGVGILSAAAGAAHAISPEGLQGIVLAAAFSSQTDTAWAPNYSAWEFRSLGVGDTQALVQRKLGEPLEKSQAVHDGKRITYWKYTTSPTKSHFHMRWILFDEGGRIEMKVSEFYVD